ncbi:MAG: hypothetical protein Q8N53_06270 [Longimicrobiales bacterium]|nr:hypothetical protein [Longimicrobiales bacterium]
MNISLPDTLKTFVERQVTQHGYGTTSEGSTAVAFAFVEAVERTFQHVLHAERDIPEHLQAPE